MIERRACATPRADSTCGDLRMRTLALVLAVWNLVVFAIYAYDKWAAGVGARRIRESTLIACAFGFGALGALVAMKLLRHKTRKPVFTMLVPFALFTSIILTVLFVLR